MKELWVKVVSKEQGQTCTGTVPMKNSGACSVKSRRYRLGTERCSNVQKEKRP